MKKVISILLVVVLMITSLSAGVVGFAETYVPNKSAGQISIVAKSEKDTYAWGDELVFIVTATNNTETDYKNVKIRAQANKAKFFYDGESNTETIDYIKAGETKDIQIKVKASSPNVFQRMFILPIYYIIDFLSPMAFRDHNFDATALVRVGAFKYRFGFEVTDGSPVQASPDDTDKLEKEVTISFNLNYAGATASIPAQTVKAGGNATAVTAPVRDGYTFMGWFTNPSCEEEYRFSFLFPIYDDLTVYARWSLDNADDTGGAIDTDKDGLLDVDETLIGTDINNPDTDGDSLTDFDEYVYCNTDPLLFDTDDDGVNDADSDSDNDGLSNKSEVILGTSPVNDDTDQDGLKDGEEVNTYLTDPLNVDTDGDGVFDGTEVRLGTNPLIAEDSFNVKAEASNGGKVKASVNTVLSGEQVESLHIKAINNTTLFPEEMPGYIGEAYDFSVDGAFDEATISFEFDKELCNDESFDPVIYYFDEEEQELEPLATTVTGNKASAVVEHFSTYILVNRKVFEESFEWVDVWSSVENYNGVELVLVIDDSGSMDWNDSSNERLVVAKNLIDKLPENSKIGVVKFESGVSVLTPSLITEKDSAKAYLTTSYFWSSGGTSMYRGIQSGLSLFSPNEDTAFKIAVVLSDGATGDTSMHSSIVKAAKEKNVKVYTVGLGSSTSYFNNYLKPLANSTGGEFYLAANASQLSIIYEDIGNKIDLSVDSDWDGLPDYYEDNLYLFNGTKWWTDKNNPDTDGDRLKDGEEIEIKFFGKTDKGTVRITNNNFTGFEKIMAMGKMISHPRFDDSDSDGFKDDVDPTPLKSDVFADMASYKKKTFGNANTITIMLRQPYWDSRICYALSNDDNSKKYRGLGASGHGFLEVIDKNNDSFFLGYGGRADVFPVAGYSLTAFTRKKIPGYRIGDESEWFTVGKTFVVSDSQLKQINDYFSSHENDDYQISNNNCTTMAVNSLIAGGLQPKIGKHIWTMEPKLSIAIQSLLGVLPGSLLLTYYGYSPADACQDIKKNYKSYLVNINYMLKDGSIQPGIMEVS